MYAEAVAGKEHFKDSATSTNRRLALQPKITPTQQLTKESPHIDSIFRDATIYDRTESRWIVRGVTGADGEKIIDLEGLNGALVTIAKS